MNIQVKLKVVYGNELIYPVCQSAKAFAAIANKKTLTNYEIQIIKTLGYTIEVVTEKKEL